MSLSGALLNAISGLSAAKRGTELTASNISNANTKGYGKKSAILMARLGSGGVDVLGVKRFQDAGLLSDRRLASAGLENSDAKQLFLKRGTSALKHKYLRPQPHGVCRQIIMYTSSLICFMLKVTILCVWY